MAEIKSTLDLVMERTKHLTLSEEEKRHLEHAEQIQKVPGFVHKFLEDVWSLHTLIDELHRIPEPVRADVAKELLRNFLKELEFSGTGEKSLAALKELASGGQRLLWQQLKDLLAEYQRLKAQLGSFHAERIRAELRAMGIDGDAVVVNGEMSPQWLTQEREYHHRLEEIRSAWLELL